MVQELKKTIIGLTGSFGTGKTTVSKMFEDLGARVFCADAIAHEALEKGSPVFERIQNLFPEALDKSGGLERRKIAEVIFKDPEAREKLEALVHPYVRESMEEQMKRAGEKVVLLDVPLLFETGMEKLCHRTVVVTAPEEITRQRLLEKGFSEEEILARTKAQMPLKEKEARASFVLDNSEDLEKTRRQAEVLFKEFCTD